jgi:hypothetical protein
MRISLRLSFLIKSILIYGFIIVGCNGSAYSSNLYIADSLNIPSEIFLKADRKEIAHQESSVSFYKTGEIFSFDSSKGYFPSLLHNIGEQAAAPFKMNAKQWLMTGSAIGITAALMHFDNDIDKWARVQKQDHNWVKKSSPVITNFGGSWGVYSVLAAGLLSATRDNEKGVQSCLLATQAMVTSGIWVRIIKTLTGRERPMADYTFSKSQGGEWYGPFSMWDQDSAIKKPVSAFDSFPSGHTATAFSIATVFAKQYSDIKAVPVLFYSAATLVGISRLTEHEHWASDVFVGGILGYLCGNQVVNHFNKTHRNPVDSLPSTLKNRTELSFVQNGNQIGFLLKW